MKYLVSDRSRRVTHCHGNVTLMLVLHRVLRNVTPKLCYAHFFQRDLATGTGLMGELASRGFISQVTK